MGRSGVVMMMFQSMSPATYTPELSVRNANGFNQIESDFLSWELKETHLTSQLKNDHTM
jgi:hypothetical protein